MPVVFATEHHQLHAATGLGDHLLHEMCVLKVSRYKKLPEMFLQQTLGNGTSWMPDACHVMGIHHACSYSKLLCKMCFDNVSECAEDEENKFVEFLGQIILKSFSMLIN
jgi:hypothetical protein